MRLAERETAFVRDAVTYLRVHGGVAWRNQAGRIIGEHKGRPWAVNMGVPGLPDVFAVYPPRACLACGEVPSWGSRVIGIECKRASGRVRPAQTVMLDQLRRRGVRAVVVYDMRDLAALVADL